MQAAEQPCSVAGPLFERLEKAAASNPRLALECGRLLPSPAQREHITRLAFLAAAAGDREAALRILPSVTGKSWIGTIGFGNAVALALKAPDSAFALLRSAAVRQPSQAVRDLSLYSGLPGARAVFEEAVSLVPGEAAALAAGRSPASREILEALRSSDDATLQELAAIATDPSIDEPARPRVAVFCRRIAARELSRAAALKLARSPAGYFGALAAMRLGANPAGARTAEAALEYEALALVRAYRDERSFAELSRFSARDLYLVLACGRAEDDDETFARLFDRVWLPAARRAGVSKVIEEAQALRLRGFLAALIQHHRLEPFLDAAGDGVLRAAMRDLDLDEALVAADILESLPESRLEAANGAILGGYESARTPEQRVIYGLLAARAARRGMRTSAVAERFLPYLREIRTLDTASLFDAKGRCVEQHFFYDDDDGAESFASFRAAYQSDPAWTWEDRGGMVRVSARGATGRRIEIWANLPVDLGIPANRGRSAESEERRQAVTRAIAAGGLEPSVYVHRGHAFHADKTLQHLNGSARLVYLGSCGGTTKVGEVLASCPRAQVIATRGIGATGINDPMLKALNDVLLSQEGPLEWRAFWERMRVRLGSSPHWSDYIAPDRDGAAIFLRAYEEYLVHSTE